MWLNRESPLLWGDRERAKRYRAKGHALHVMVRIKVKSTITLEPG
jgi:hypothetical protein